mmetsp:Transcript_1232/g.3546  ORF Transcript_1232/g.3546 Transcript_1232/m.3546 type:complete len:290 (+) Transcript_1232:449-1318(+)
MDGSAERQTSSGRSSGRSRARSSTAGSSLRPRRSKASLMRRHSLSCMMRLAEGAVMGRAALAVRAPDGCKLASRAGAVGRSRTKAWRAGAPARCSCCADVGLWRRARVSTASSALAKTERLTAPPSASRSTVACRSLSNTLGCSARKFVPVRKERRRDCPPGASALPPPAPPEAACPPPCPPAASPSSLSSSEDASASRSCEFARAASWASTLCGCAWKALPPWDPCTAASRLRTLSPSALARSTAHLSTTCAMCSVSAASTASARRRCTHRASMASSACAVAASEATR